LLDEARALLAASTAALVAAARAEAPDVVSYLLVYLPTVLDAAAPEVRRATVPIGWASPAFDVLQLEDYDWVVAGDRGSTARGFRFRDPFDDSARGMTDPPGAADQMLGIGDGSRTRFPLLKRYGAGEDAQVRRITRPVGPSVRVSRGGVEAFGGWTLEPGGIVAFDAAPAAGVEIAAGFRFDVPVRFAADTLETSRATFLAGEAASVPLIEIREGAA
jgi:uncharacterized protein (TIGR02217 family)